ncbi:MAG: VWA domain-containing protein [Thermoguttaceae bacterium]|jgi:hypothetical protein
MTTVLVCFVLASGAALAPAAEPKEPPRRHAPLVFSSPGEKARVTFFGIQADGGKFVYVLDRSGSMGIEGGKPLAAAKAELIASLGGLSTVQQFQIIFYNEAPRIFNPTGQAGRLAFGSEVNKAQGRSFIESINADGATDHEAALMTAIRLRPDVIFFLTDGDDPQLSAQQLDRLDRRGAGITIHTIQFGTGPQRKADNFMVRLARQSGGQHIYVDTSKLDQPARGQ